MNYVELPARDLPRSHAFYEKAFGWTLASYGPTYSATTTDDVDIGLQADLPEATQAPLPIIQVTDLEAALAAVQRAGGQISKPIFSFPGGRRFHFRDPSGNELAAWQKT
ncbi:MAG TPA: VOC family protein [Steroidobacteraceae bacterium]